ncbi:MAG: hypothetical protein LBM01_00995 [Christensenellaceae bacterium]|jgi:hypothetical protein|nr:hypothetical protein [Christensenellaceae bacterium]
MSSRPNAVKYKLTHLRKQLNTAEIKLAKQIESDEARRLKLEAKIDEIKDELTQYEKWFKASVDDVNEF